MYVGMLTNMKRGNTVKSLKKAVCIGLAAIGIASLSCTGALAFEHPAWSGVDENGNTLMQVQNADGTWEDLPTWQEAYAALDYDSAPDDIKEVILVARRCLILEKVVYLHIHCIQSIYLICTILICRKQP